MIHSRMTEIVLAPPYLILIYVEYKIKYCEFRSNFVKGELPTENQVSALSKEWALRSHIPDYVKTMLKNLPASLHPMAQLSCAISSLHHHSKFAKAYHKGIKKSQYWEYFYEDAMELIGKITVISAIIFNNTYRKRLGILYVFKSSER